MSGPVREVTPELLIRANEAAADGPRGYENAMISIIKALSKEATPDDLLAVTYRLQALANLHRGAEDIAGFTMSQHGKEYKLISEAALKAAALCPLTLSDEMADIQFDRERFLELALSFTEAEGNG
jgi:hypothetical protein